MKKNASLHAAWNPELASDCENYLGFDIVSQIDIFQAGKQRLIKEYFLRYIKRIYTIFSECHLISHSETILTDELRKSLKNIDDIHKTKFLISPFAYKQGGSRRIKISQRTDLHRISGCSSSGAESFAIRDEKHSK